MQQRNCKNAVQTERSCRTDHKKTEKKNTCSLVFEFGRFYLLGLVTYDIVYMYSMLATLLHALSTMYAYMYLKTFGL